MEKPQSSFEYSPPLTLAEVVDNNYDTLVADGVRGLNPPFVQCSLNAPGNGLVVGVEGSEHLAGFSVSSSFDAESLPELVGIDPELIDRGVWTVERHDFVLRAIPHMNRSRVTIS